MEAVGNSFIAMTMNPKQQTDEVCRNDQHFVLCFSKRSLNTVSVAVRQEKSEHVFRLHLADLNKSEVQANHGLCLFSTVTFLQTKLSCSS